MPKTIIVDNLQLVADRKNTFLNSDLSSGVGTMSVQSIIGITTNQILLIGDFGKENSEIILTHASTSPSGSTVTFASNTLFSHSRGTNITILAWDQIEISWSATATGSKSVLSTISIQADLLSSLYDDTSKSNGYYFYRFKNSLTTTYSDYSNAIPFAGYGDNTVYAIKQRALEELGETIGTLITNARLNKYLDQGRRELDNNPLVLRWSFRQKFDQDIGDAIPGAYSIIAPTDLRDPNTNKNIFGLRIGKFGQALEYQTPQRFKENYRNIAHATLNGSITTADTSIVLTKSGDFDESGNIVIGAETISGVLDTVSYSANNESTQTISGVTGIGANKSTGVDVWQNATFGLPRNYTIIDGYIYFDVPFSDDYAGENIYMDYYSTIVTVNDDGDELDEPEYDMYVSYLKYRIKSLKSNGKLERDSDPDFKDWKERSISLINKEISGQDIILIPE